MSFIERTQLVEDIHRLCHGLNEADALCDECYTKLKAMSYYAIIGEPSIRDNAIDRQQKGSVILHTSCATRLLELFLSYFLGKIPPVVDQHNREETL